jgi:carboxypeptidase C (cathepsin A)
MERPYRTSGGRQLYSSWNWRPVAEDQAWEPSYVDVTRELSRTLRRNGGLRVLVACGYYDFATPFFDAEYTFARHGVLPERVSWAYYQAGHMMYLHQPSHDALLARMREFLSR